MVFAKVTPIPYFVPHYDKMLLNLVERVKVVSQISGVIPHLVEDGLFILHYADKTLARGRSRTPDHITSHQVDRVGKKPAGQNS